MRQVTAIVVGGLIGLGLMRLLIFLLGLLEVSAGGYALLVLGIVGGLLVGLVIGIFSRALGTVVGFVLIILLSVAGAILDPSISLIVGIVAISIICYFIAGLIAGAFAGASFAEGYHWGRGAAIIGLPAGILLLGFNLIYSYATGSAVMGTIAFVDAVGWSVPLALVLGAIGGAVGGQLAGVRV